MCPVSKTTGMAKNYMTFYRGAQRAVDNGLTYSQIKDGASDIMFRLSQQKFEEPADGEDAIKEKLLKLNKDIETTLRDLQD